MQQFPGAAPLPHPGAQPAKKPFPIWLFLVGLAVLTVFGLASGPDDIPPIVVLIVAVPVLILFLVIRALIRVGDKRPPPVVLAPPPQNLPPAGWYTDGAGAVRWHNGTEWTDIVQPPTS
ncbi:DUF2510 domain-containing protein [Nocardia sp. NPDC004860]|uniref:DUF2510 domain-containing protein n=1 Tax=Nocardia sp. NPDC004860 TaxID=3154557 RepID=UPI0033A78042